MRSQSNIQLLSVGTVIVLICLGIFGCGQKAESEIKIGGLLVLSGPDANYGIDSKRGIDLAVEELNERGGLAGKNVRIVYEDTRGEPRTSATACQKLIAVDKVSVIIGAIFSSSTLAAAPIAEENQVVLLSPGSSNPSITNSGDYIFRNWISDLLEGSEMAHFAYDNLGFRKAAILYIKNDYGKGLEEVFSRVFDSLGGKITSVESYEQGALDFRTQLTKIKAGAPDAIYIPGYYKEMAELLKQAKELGIKQQFLSTVTFEEPKLLEIAGRAAEGVIYSTPLFDPDSKDTVVSEFVKRFENRYKRAPGIFAAHGYDAAKIVYLAMKNGGTSAEEIRDALYRIHDYPGVSGTTTFDRNGDVIKPVVIKVVRNMKFERFSRDIQ